MNRPNSVSSERRRLSSARTRLSELRSSVVEEGPLGTTRIRTENTTRSAEVKSDDAEDLVSTDDFESHAAAQARELQRLRQEQRCFRKERENLRAQVSALVQDSHALAKEHEEAIRVLLQAHTRRLPSQTSQIATTSAPGGVPITNNAHADQYPLKVQNNETTHAGIGIRNELAAMMVGDEALNGMAQSASHSPLGRAARTQAEEQADEGDSCPATIEALRINHQEQLERQTKEHADALANALDTLRANHDADLELHRAEAQTQRTSLKETLTQQFLAQAAADHEMRLTETARTHCEQLDQLRSELESESRQASEQQTRASEAEIERLKSELERVSRKCERETEAHHEALSKQHAAHQLDLQALREQLEEKSRMDGVEQHKVALQQQIDQSQVRTEELVASAVAAAIEHEQANSATQIQELVAKHDELVRSVEHDHQHEIERLKESLEEQKGELRAEQEGEMLCALEQCRLKHAADLKQLTQTLETEFAERLLQTQERISGETISQLLQKQLQQQLLLQQESETHAAIMANQACSQGDICEQLVSSGTSTAKHVHDTITACSDAQQVVCLRVQEKLDGLQARVARAENATEGLRGVRNVYRHESTRAKVELISAQGELCQVKEMLAMKRQQVIELQRRQHNLTAALSQGSAPNELCETIAANSDAAVADVKQVIQVGTSEVAHESSVALADCNEIFVGVDDLGGSSLLRCGLVLQRAVETLMETLQQQNTTTLKHPPDATPCVASMQALESQLAATAQAMDSLRRGWEAPRTYSDLDKRTAAPPPHIDVDGLALEGSSSSSIVNVSALWTKHIEESGVGHYEASVEQATLLAALHESIALTAANHECVVGELERQRASVEAELCCAQEQLTTIHNSMERQATEHQEALNTHGEERERLNDMLKQKELELQALRDLQAECLSNVKCVLHTAIVDTTDELDRQLTQVQVAQEQRAQESQRAFERAREGLTGAVKAQSEMRKVAFASILWAMSLQRSVHRREIQARRQNQEQLLSSIMTPETGNDDDVPTLEQEQDQQHQQQQQQTVKVGDDSTDDEDANGGTGEMEKQEMMDVKHAGGVLAIAALDATIRQRSQAAKYRQLHTAARAMSSKVLQRRREFVQVEAQWKISQTQCAEADANSKQLTQSLTALQTEHQELQSKLDVQSDEYSSLKNQVKQSEESDGVLLNKVNQVREATKEAETLRQQYNQMRCDLEQSKTRENELCVRVDHAERSCLSHQQLAVTLKSKSHALAEIVRGLQDNHKRRQTTSTPPPRQSCSSASGLVAHASCTTNCGSECDTLVAQAASRSNTLYTVDAKSAGGDREDDVALEMARGILLEAQRLQATATDRESELAAQKVQLVSRERALGRCEGAADHVREMSLRMRAQQRANDVLRDECVTLADKVCTLEHHNNKAQAEQESDEGSENLKKKQEECEIGRSLELHSLVRRLISQNEKLVQDKITTAQVIEHLASTVVEGDAHVCASV